MNIKRLYPKSILPTRSYHSAGYDLYSLVDVVLAGLTNQEEIYDRFNINELIRTKFIPKDTVTTLIPTGIAVEIPPGYVGLIRDRSGVGVRGLYVTAGVIDSDYRGEIIICMNNPNPFSIAIPAGTKIAQMVVVPCLDSEVVEVQTLSETDRGSHGFGSSNVGPENNNVKEEK